jgi:hypothetical protein
MAVTSTDLLMIERGGTLYKAPVSELPSGDGGAAGLVLLQQETITTTVAAIDFDLPSGYSRFRLIGQDVRAGGSHAYLLLSTNGGTGFLSSGYGYRLDGLQFTSASGRFANFKASHSYMLLQQDQKYGVAFDYLITNTANYFTLTGLTVGFQEEASECRGTTTYGHRIMSSIADVLRYTNVYGPTIGGDYSAGTLSLYGYKETV